MKFRYVLLWFAGILNAAVIAFFACRLVHDVSTTGWFGTQAVIDYICLGINLYAGSTVPSSFRKLRQLDQVIASLDDLIADLDKIRAERDQELIDDPNAPPAIKLVKKIEAERRKFK